MDGIDPLIYFENGNAYYCANDCGERMKLTGTEGIFVKGMVCVSYQEFLLPLRIEKERGSNTSDF